VSDRWVPAGARIPRQQNPEGVFVAFEGGEATGKSTQAALLAESLRARGSDVVTTREPGATPVGAEIRAIVLNRPDDYLTAHTELLLLTADKAEHVRRIIRPALQRGAIVVSDRYTDSSLAYQGHGRGLAEEDIAWLSAWATGGLVPDLTVVLDMPVQTRGVRMAARAGDRMEAEADAFHEAVRACYLRLAARAPDRYLVVDASRPVDRIAARILAAVDRIQAARTYPVAVNRTLASDRHVTDTVEWRVP